MAVCRLSKLFRFCQPGGCLGVKMAAGWQVSAPKSALSLLEGWWLDRHGSFGLSPGDRCSVLKLQSSDHKLYFLE
jgi:hypothetical protein